MMSSKIRQNISHRGAMLASLLLVLALIFAAAWQWQNRAHQSLDVGSPFDDGAVLNFHAAEKSTASTLSFRWSARDSEVRLWALRQGTPVALMLRMLPPPGSMKQVALTIGDKTIGSFTLHSGLRNYSMLTTIPNNNEIAIGINSPRQSTNNDPRSLGVALVHVALDALPAPTAADFVSEFWSTPFLPLGLLLLAACMLLLRLPSITISGVPALTLAVVVMIGHYLPEVQLRVALYVIAIAVISIIALLLAALLRRLRSLWPNTDQRARYWLLFVFVIVLIATFSPNVRSDGLGYYVYLRSLTMDGDLNFGNEYREWPYQKEPSQVDLQITPTGHYVNFFAIGPAMLWSPLYGAAHLIVLSERALGSSVLANGYTTPYIVLSTFTSALAGLVILLASYQICRRWVGPSVATLAAISTFLGSNLLFYTMREGSFAHAVSAAMGALYVLAWLRLEEQPSLRRWAVLGVTAGLISVTYWISALVLLLTALTFARLLIAAVQGPASEPGPRITRLLIGGSTAALLTLLLFSPQLIAWKIIYGSFVTVPQGTDFISLKSFNGLAMLFAPLHGLLPWTPGFFVGMLGLLLLWRRNRWLSVCLVLSFLSYFVYNAYLSSWHGKGAFGLRRLTLLTPWFAIGLALIFDTVRRWRSSLPVVLAALIMSWSTLVLVRYDLDLIPHSPTQLHKMSTTAFYLSRETFPLWAFSGWLRNSYFSNNVRGMFSFGFDGEFVAIAIVMVLATGIVVLLGNRLAMIPYDTSKILETYRQGEKHIQEREFVTSIDPPHL